MAANPAAIQECLLGVKSQNKGAQGGLDEPISPDLPNMALTEEQLDMVAGGASRYAVINNGKANYDSIVRRVGGRDRRSW